MKDRIKTLRSREGLTQQQFADSLGISRGNIAAYEVGKNPPSDAVISLICKEYNVNETWLRTGEGEMFIPLSRKDSIMQLAESMMQTETASFKERFFLALSKLDEDEWEILEKIVDEIAKEKD